MGKYHVVGTIEKYFSMSHITYLIGAGASIAALPVVSQIPDRYTKFVRAVIEITETQFGSYLQSPDPHLNDRNNYWHSKLIMYLRFFEEGIVNHSSVDTYAKKLYLQGSEMLRAYKICLSSYLAYEQIVCGPDKRYDTFFASILKSTAHDFPQNICIVSWNYDTQFEIGYSNYTGASNYRKVREQLNIICKDEDVNQRDEKFKIVKLNGTIGVYSKSEKEMAYMSKSPYSRSTTFQSSHLDEFVKYLQLVEEQRASPLLSFAWENENYVSNTTQTKLAIYQTSVLVVIGYSFPYFNREIDRYIFSEMRSLEKVYIQNPDANELIDNVNHLCTRARFDKPIEIVPFTNTHQFLIPNELD